MNIKKIILHIPRLSTEIPFLDWYVNEEYKIQSKLINLTNWYTYELFYSETDEMIVAPFSRISSDL